MGISGNVQCVLSLVLEFLFLRECLVYGVFLFLVGGDGQASNFPDRSPKKMPLSRKKTILCGENHFDAVPAQHRNGMTASFEHLNRLIRALLESLRDCRSDSGAVGGALVSVELTCVRQNFRFGKVLRSRKSFFDNWFYHCFDY